MMVTFRPLKMALIVGTAARTAIERTRRGSLAGEIAKKLAKQDRQSG